MVFSFNYWLVKTTSKAKKRQNGDNLNIIKAPDFNLADLDGNVINFSAYEGQVIMLTFWGTWCGPCRQEIPDFIELYDQYNDKGLEIVGIAIQSGSAENIKRFSEYYKINYPILTDINGNESYKAFSDYGLISGVGTRAVPTTFLIDRNGNITIGSESITQMAYDPTSPVMGAVTGGNFSGELFPQNSNDLITLEWSEFLETDEGESGVETYEVLVRKLADGDCDCLDGDGAIIADCEASVDYTDCVSAVDDNGFASTWSLADIADSVLIDWTNVLPPTTNFEYSY